MGGVWHKFDPELIEAYAAACPLLEKGQPRVQVLTDHVVRLICYGGKRAILPTVYLTDVPDEWIKKWKLSRKDFELFLMEEKTDEADKVIKLLEGKKLSLKEKEEVARDALEDFNRIVSEATDSKSRVRVDLTREALRHYLER